MSAVDRFLLDPLDFMQNNFVTTPEGGSVNETGGKKFFTLELQRGTACSIERKDASLRVYILRPCTNNNPAGILEIYWCPYKENSIQSTTVGNAANFMFTAPMNGCSFGIGAPADDGSRYVAHINMKSQKNAWNKQDAILKGSKLGNAIISPHMYMGDDTDPVHVVTFGIRTPKTKEWNFYYQLTKMGAGAAGVTRTVVGVFPV